MLSPRRCLLGRGHRHRRTAIRIVEDTSPWPIHRGPGPAHERPRRSSASGSPSDATPSSSRVVRLPRPTSAWRCVPRQKAMPRRRERPSRPPSPRSIEPPNPALFHANAAARRKSRLMRRAEASLGGESLVTTGKPSARSAKRPRPGLPRPASPQARHPRPRASRRLPARPAPP